MSYIGQQTNQQSLNGIIDLTDGTITIVDGDISNVKSLSLNGEINMNTNKIINLKDGENAGDAVNKAQLDAISVNLNDYVRRDGTSSMTGNLNLNSNKIINLATATADTDCVNKLQMDNSLNLLRSYVDSQDASLRTYTDSSLNLLRSYTNSQLALKADKTYTDSSLNLLRSYTDSSLNLLRDYVNTQDGADRVYVDTSLNLLRTYVNNNFVNLSTDQTISGIKSFNSGVDFNGATFHVNASTAVSFSSLVSVNLGGGAMLNNKKIEYLANGTNATDAVNKSQLDLKGDLTYIDNSLNSLRSYVDTQDNLKVNKAGDTMTGVLTINKNATNFSKLTIVSSSSYTIATTNTIYDIYDLTYSGAGSTFELPSYPASNPNGVSPDTIMINRVIYFKISGSTQVILTPRPLSGSGGTSITVDGTVYSSTSLTKTSSFALVGSSSVSIYTTLTYQELENLDQLTLKSSLGTNTNTEFSGIKFLNTTTDAGFIRTETDRFHNNSTMSFQVRQSNNIIKPLDINSTINAYRPIIRNQWSSGELIQTKIYNQNNSGTGVKNIGANSGSVLWKSVDFTMMNNVSDSWLCVEVSAPYYMSGYGGDVILSQVRDYTGSVEQQVHLSSEFWEDQNGGGARGAQFLPIMCSYTPSNSTTNKSRTIEIRFNNASNSDGLFICQYRLSSTSATIYSADYYTIKISEYKK